MTIARDTLVTAIDRIAEAMERDFDELNTADGALGDGDLGITMARGMRAIVEFKDELPDDLGMALFQCARILTKSSASSYGTLMATGLMSAANTLKGKSSVESHEVSQLFVAARDKMRERGKAKLGGKTVLDSLDYVAKATDGTQNVAAAAASAVDKALEDFRDKPATVGRARIFGEKSVGMDDPGMLAMQRIVKAAVSHG